MNRSVQTTLFVATIVLFTPVVSGPLVSGIDFSSNAGGATERFGTGSASVEVVSVPTESITLKQGSFDSGTYHVSAPPAVVSVTAVDGNPYIEYVIEIPGLDIVDIHTYTLSDTVGKRLELTVRPFELSPTRVQKDTYKGTLIVRIQADELTVLHRSTIHLPVMD